MMMMMIYEQCFSILVCPSQRARWTHLSVRMCNHAMRPAAWERKRSLNVNDRSRGAATAVDQQQIITIIIIIIILCFCVFGLSRINRKTAKHNNTLCCQCCGDVVWCCRMLLKCFCFDVFCFLSCSVIFVFVFSSACGLRARQTVHYVHHYLRTVSVTSFHVSLSLMLWNVNTVVHNTCVLFQNQLTRSTNSIVPHPQSAKTSRTIQ